MATVDDPRSVAAVVRRRRLHFPVCARLRFVGIARHSHNAAEHVVFGIVSRQTYILRACVASLWQAATVLSKLHPAVATNLNYSGESFGGGLGALMLPWDERFRRAHLVVPTFGHHPLRLQCPCAGSGEAVRQLYARQPGILDVLRYYDAAVAAQRITIPTLCMPALFDPAVPPPGQFAVANALSGEHEILSTVAGTSHTPGRKMNCDRRSNVFEIGSTEVSPLWKRCCAAS
jgi:cephalosporin-C deacetylase